MKKTKQQKFLRGKLQNFVLNKIKFVLVFINDFKSNQIKKLLSLDERMTKEIDKLLSRLGKLLKQKEKKLETFVCRTERKLEKTLFLFLRKKQKEILSSIKKNCYFKIVMAKAILVKKRIGEKKEGIILFSSSCQQIILNELNGKKNHWQKLQALISKKMSYVYISLNKFHLSQTKKCQSKINRFFVLLVKLSKQKNQRLKILLYEKEKSLEKTLILFSKRKQKETLSFIKRNYYFKLAVAKVLLIKRIFKQVKKTVRLKKRELVLPLYFDWQIRLILERNTIKFFRPFKNYWQEAIALLLLITLTTSSFLFRQPQPALGATFTWFQTDWSNADTVNFPVHPGDGLGWAKYYAQDALIATTSGAITLQIAADSWTQTTDDDFNSGILDDVVASGDDLRLLPWYNSNWSYRKAINVSNPASSTTDYSVQIELTPSNFDYSHASSTLADLRFTTSTAATITIPYWIETASTTATSTVWVKVPSLSEAATTTIYMYYGNSTANSESNGTSTFIFFDDFNSYNNTSDPAFLAKWTNDYGAVNWNWAISSGRLQYYASGDSGRMSVMISTSTVGTDATDMALYFDSETTPGGSYWETGWYVRYTPSATQVGDGVRIKQDNTYARVLAGYTASCAGTLSYSVTNRSYKIVTLDGSKYDFYDSNSLQRSCTSLTKPYGYAAWFVGSSSNQVTGYLDNVRMAKYLSPTPTNTFGEEERNTEERNNGSLISSSMDTTVNYSSSTLAWNATTTASTTVKFQITSSPDNISWTDFQGPDGATSTYYTSSGTTISGHNGNRYIKYKAFLETTDGDETPYLHDVTINYDHYPATTTLTSSPYDSSSDANIPASLAWSETLPTGADIKFQIRTSPDNSTWTEWVGPNGSTTDYYTDNAGGEDVSAALSDGVNDRWIQYKVFLTSTGANAPTLSDVTFTYVVNAPPELNNVTASQSNLGIVTIDYATRDPDTNEGTNTPWYVTPSFEYSLNNGDTWVSPTSSCFAAEDWSNKSVTTSTWSNYQATWTPKCEAGISNTTYSTTTKIKITIDDNEGANRYGSSTTAVFTLDTKSPVLGGNPVLVNGSQSPALITVSAIDDSSMQMKVGLTADLSGVDWITYNPTTTLNLTDPDTVYVQFRDAYNNTSTISNVTSPETPTNIYYQDISNPDTNEWREFVSWSVVSEQPAGFKQYNIYRSTNGSNYSITATSTRLVNYIIDDNLSSTTEYYYKINVEDNDGDISFFSSIISDAPQGEGGTDLSSPVISAVATSSPGTNSITVTWTTNELSNSTVGYSTASGIFTTETGVASMVTSHSVTLTGLTPNSTYYFQVKSSDASTNERIDNNGGSGYVFSTNQGPLISNVTTPEITNNTANISWITNTNANSYVVYSTSSNLSNSSETGSTATSTIHSVNLSSLTQGTKYYFYVKSTDTSSNLATDKNVVDGVIQYYTFTTTQDTTAPTISSISASNATSSSIITWTTNELADSTVNYGTTDSYGSTATSSTLTINHVLELNSLTNNTTYHYRVISTDANGNTTTSTDKTFLTNAIADAVDPVISSIATSSVNLTSATITWTTNEAANSLIDYGTTVSLGSLAGQIDDSATTHSVSLNNLTASTTYYYQVRSQDSSGNTGTDNNGGNYYSFITTQDTTAPTISSVSSSTVSNNSATIIWTTNELSTSQINYGTTDSYGSQTTQDSTLTYQHSVKLTNLTKQTTYHFQAVSEDSADNSTSSSDYTLLTTDDPGIVETVNSGGVIFVESSSSNKDTTAPIISNIRVINISQSSATITWSTNEDTDTFVEYGTTKNYEQGYLGSYDNTMKHSLKLTSLSPGTTYYFRALGKDSSGNLSRSSQQNFTTLTMNLGAIEEVPTEEKGLVESIMDSLSKVVKESLQLNSNGSLASVSDAIEETAQRINKPPLIAGNDPLVEVGSDWAKITWVTDKKSNSIVAYVENETYDPGKADAYSDINGNPDEQVTSHTVTLNNLKTETTYHFQARSKSTLGDWAKSPDKTFTTLSMLPQISRARLVAITETSVTLQWNTNLPTQSRIDVIDSATGAKIVKKDDNYLKEHQLTIENLDVSTDYSLQIFSNDEKNNKSTSEILSFSTSLSLEPPTISQVRINTTLVPGKIERIQAIISWKTNKPATSRIFYEEGAGQNKTLNNGTSLDSGLEIDHIVITTAFKPGKVYRFRVESVDAFGNISASQDFTILTPKPKESVLDLMINNFEQTFEFLNRLKF